MFFSNFDSHWTQEPKEVIEMEDIEIDDDIDTRPTNRPQQAPENFTPATFKIEPRNKNHLNTAAHLVMGSLGNKDGPLSPKVHLVNQPNQNTDQKNSLFLNQNSDIATKITVQRPETEIKSPKKPKIQGRLLGNLSVLAPKTNLQQNNNNNNILSNNNPRLIQDRNVNTNITNESVAQPSEAYRVPKRKLFENNNNNLESNDLFAGDPIVKLNKKPRAKLLTNLF